MAYYMKDAKLKENNMILKDVSIDGNICGSYAEICINQIYENRGNENIEGVYIFPVPKKAIISGLDVEIGGRTLKALIEEKEKAFNLIENAKKRGEGTLMLEEFKPHMFKLSIGKIIPGESVNIRLKYIDELAYEDKSYILTIKALLEPKNLEASRWEDVKIKSLKSGVISRIIKRENEIKFRANIVIESLCKLNFKSLNHNIIIERKEDNICRINLEENSLSLQKDFILLIKEEEEVEYGAFVYNFKEKEQEKSLVYIRTLPDLQNFEVDEIEKYIFLIDVSDTMKGEKLEEAKNALQICIRNLDNTDYFNIVAMGEDLKVFSDSELVPFTDENLKKASKWISNLTAEEDADIFGGLKYSLSKENNGNTILLFTDDLVENEEEILNYVKSNINNNRIFTFGIDSCANNYFLNKLANFSFGKAEFVNKGESIENIILKQFNRIQNPQIDNVKIDWGDFNVESTYPRTIEYIYSGEPFSIFALIEGKISGKINLHGDVGIEKFKKEINLYSFNNEKSITLLKKIWARKRIKSIELNIRAARGEMKEAMNKKVVEISKGAGILSSKTTFILLELRDEPVLGIQLKNIIPLKINENTMSDELENEYLEQWGFVYKSESEFFDDTDYLDKKYPREKIFRILAKNQLADGSFADYLDNQLEDKLKTTAMSILAYTTGKEDVTLYLNQLNKSIEFICSSVLDTAIILEHNVIKMIILALNGAEKKGVIKYKNLEKVKNVVNYLYEILNKKSEWEYIIKSLVEYSFYSNVISLFKLSDDSKYINECIVIKDENSSIFNIAKLAVLKAIKKGKI